MNQRPTHDLVISTSDLQMRYGSTQVLDGIDLDVEAGGVVAVLGPNGAGKSTTIEILEGFRSRSGGEVSVLGADPATADESWRSQIGVVLQNSGDHGKWRPEQLLGHLGDFYRPYVDPWPVNELLELVGLTEQAGQLHVHPSQDATAFVRELLIREGEAVTELEIQRTTLEDAYLSIVEQFEAGETVEAAEFQESTP